MTLSLKSFEAELATHPHFGSASAIHARTDGLYRRRLSKLAASLPVAGTLSRELDRTHPLLRRYFLRDSALRMAVDQALAHERSLRASVARERVHALLEEAVVVLQSRSRLALLEAEPGSELEFGPPALGPRVWSGAIPVNAARDLVLANALDIVPHSKLATLTERHVQNLKLAARILERLVPRLWASALEHVVAILFLDDAAGQFCGGTNSSLPGVLLLSPRVLSNPLVAAEQVLHEACHLKFIDIEYTVPIGKNDAGTMPAPSPTFDPPWHPTLPKPPHWNVKRTLTAMHVYAALAAFFAAEESEAEELEAAFGAAHASDLDRRIALDRAHYLSRALGRHPAALGEHGVRFVHWVESLITAFDAAVPKGELELELMLELYVEKARDAAARVAASPAVGPEPSTPQIPVDDRETWIRLFAALDLPGHAAALAADSPVPRALQDVVAIRLDATERLRSIEPARLMAAGVQAGATSASLTAALLRASESRRGRTGVPTPLARV